MEIAAGHQALATKVDVLDAKAEVKLIQADLKLVEAEVKAELNKVEGSLSRWVLTCVLSAILAQTTVLTGLGYFVLQHLRK